MLYSPEFQEVWEYWLRIRGDELIPRRKEFEPAALSSRLGDIGIMDWDGEKYYLRLLGSSAIEELGVDFSGQKVTQVGTPAVHDFAVTNFRKIFCFPCGLQTVFVERAHSGLVVEAAVLFLPLRVDDATINQVVTCRRHLSTIGYDDKHPNLVHLGINRMEYIDLGCGLPDIDLEKALEKTRYEFPGWNGAGD